MDSEKILLDLYKQQQYDESHTRLQKLFMLVGGFGSAVALIGAILYFISWWYIVAFSVTVLCFVLNATLVKLSLLKLGTACFLTMLFACFIFLPPFWFLTGLSGSAPFVAIVILVSIHTLYNGKTLKWLLSAYLVLLAGLTVYSSIVEFSKPDFTYTAAYVVIGFIMTVGSIVMYMLYRHKEFNELNDKFLRSSFRDELTQLYNRKLLDLIIEYQETQYKQKSQNYVFVMFDVDDFKKMNDKHGHIFGDIVLRSIAECIHNTTRGSDFVVRYGGDEFLVIQTNASEESVKTFVDRIEAQLKASCQLEIPVDLTLGYAARSECNTPGAVLQLADERMLKKKAEKKAGR